MWSSFQLVKLQQLYLQRRERTTGENLKMWLAVTQRTLILNRGFHLPNKMVCYSRPTPNFSLMFPYTFCNFFCKNLVQYWCLPWGDRVIMLDCRNILNWIDVKLKSLGKHLVYKHVVFDDSFLIASFWLINWNRRVELMHTGSLLVSMLPYIWENQSIHRFPKMSGYE